MTPIQIHLLMLYGELTTFQYSTADAPSGVVARANTLWYVSRAKVVAFSEVPFLQVQSQPARSVPLADSQQSAAQTVDREAQNV